MKTKTLIITFFILSTIANLVLAQGAGKVSLSDLSFRQSVRLQEGMNTVNLEKNKGTLLILVREGNIFNLSLKKTSGKIKRFKTKTDGQTSGNMDCPNGVSCWEDEEQQMSICVCKSSGGGGGNYFLRFDGVDGESE